MTKLTQGLPARSIGAVALKRLRGESLPKCRWSLGKLGLPINIFALSATMISPLLLNAGMTELMVEKDCA
jgi:hypothetical protein